MENDFHFTSDAELEQEMDAILNALEEQVMEEEGKTTLLNVLRLKQLQFAYGALLYLTQGSNVSVTYRLYEPFKTMGSVSAEGECLAFDKPEWFARIAEFASNMEVYPLEKNKVRMTFTFHGLTAPVE